MATNSEIVLPIISGILVPPIDRSDNRSQTNFMAETREAVTVKIDDDNDDDVASSTARLPNGRLKYVAIFLPDYYPRL